MLLRYGSDDRARIIEVSRMFYSNGNGYFVTTEKFSIKVRGIASQEWQRLVSDMFVDGKLSLNGFADADIDEVR